MKNQYACTSCHTISKPKTKTKGSSVLELSLFIGGILGALFIAVPLIILSLIGLLYSISRTGKKTKTCPACGSTAIVPLHTPAGQAILTQNHPKT
jgi:hypothetical protein